MWRFYSAVIALAAPALAETSVQDSEVTLTRGTTGLGIHLVSESRGRGAVIQRVVPESAASLVLRAGDVCTWVAGIEIRHWSLDNIKRLLEPQGRVRLQIQRRIQATPESQLDNIFLHAEEELDLQAKTASCYASVNSEGGISDVHALECTPANFGGDLPSFSVAEPGFVLPVAVAQPLEYCVFDESFDASGRALLVARGGCLPHVKAQNAARSGAALLLVVDGQFPPFPPLPRTASKRLPPPLTSAHPSAKAVDIPVLAIHNETGQRIMDEVRENNGEVMIVSHAGDHPSRPTRKPRNQVPLAEAERLRPAEDAFELSSAFLDGHIAVSLGTPGLPGGNVENTRLQVMYELSALLTGLKETIHFTRAVRCPVCDGRGAREEDMRPCKSCSSSAEPGISSLRHSHSHEVKQTIKTTCSRCHGFGEVPKKGRTCPRCNGARVIQERASLEIVIPRGAPDPHRITFLGMGSQFPTKRTGSVEIVATAKPNDRFRRDGANLWTELNITLTEALAGFTRDLQLLNGSSIFLNRTRMTSHEHEVEVIGGGLPRWHSANAGKTNSGRKGAHSNTPGTSSDVVENTDFDLGSLFISYTVTFPDHPGGHFKGNLDTI